MNRWLTALAVVAMLSTPALATQDTEATSQQLDSITELFLTAIENGTPLTDLSKQCPLDQQPREPEYYSDDPETQKFCVANPCHCF